MASQKSGGNKKRPDNRPCKKRYNNEDRQAKNKLKRQAKHIKRQRKGQKVVLEPFDMNFEPIMGKTFDDDYKEFRRTRGKRGLNPDPLVRRFENPNVDKLRHDPRNVQKVPIQDLMSKPIGKL